MTVLADVRITSIVDEIVAKFFPRKIILFGSYAYGEPTKDSDVDLLVIMPTKIRALRKAAEISAAIEHPLPIDLIVRTPKDIQERVAQGDSFISEVLTKGIVVHET